MSWPSNCMKRRTPICQILQVSAVIHSFVSLLHKIYCKTFTLHMSQNNSNLASKGADDEPQKVKAAVFSNIALCHLKLKNYYEVKKAVS